MAKRQISRLAPRGPHEWSPGDVRGAIGELRPLSQAQRSHLAYAARSTAVRLGEGDFEVFDHLRRKFFLATSRRLLAASIGQHGRVHRKLVEAHRAFADVAAVLLRDEPIDEVILRTIGDMQQVRPGLFLAMLPQAQATAGALEGLVKAHERPLVDEQTPFEGLVCEASWYWREVLRVEPAVSNRPPLSGFTKFMCRPC